MATLLNRYQVNGPGGLLLLGALLAGIVAGLILLFYPVGYITGNHPFWQSPTGDLAQHSTGANFFMLGSWGYPLFHVPELGIPGGTSIVYTDSLPLMALVFRLVRVVTGEAQLYFSYWIFGSALLQAPCFCFALYAAGVRNGLVLALSGLLVLFSPIWWFAFSHVQLFGHFLILIGLALYFLTSRGKGTARVVLWFVPLLALAMTISGYMFFMVAMLFGLALLSGLWRGHISALGALATLAGSGALCLAIMVAGGYTGTTLVPKNYGLFSLNLLGFVTPQMSGLIPGFDDYVLDATGGQSQGFAYLGLGVLPLVLLALWFGRDSLRLCFRDDPTLLIGGLAILLYAASYAVYFGPVLIAGVSHATVKQAFLQIVAGEVRPAQALAALSVFDYLRIGALATVAAVLPLSLILLAWRQQKAQLLIFLAMIAVLLLGALLVSPKSVLFAIGTLHASGRYAWLLVYLIMALSIATLARRLPTGPFAVILTLALLFQILDSGPVQHRLRAEIREGERPPFSDRTELEKALVGSERFIISPNFHCANLEIEDRDLRKSVTRTILQLEFLASETATPINSVLNARLTTVRGLIELPDCDEERGRAMAADWGPGTTYFFLADATPPQQLDSLRSDSRRCRSLSYGVLCRDSAEP